MHSVALHDHKAMFVEYVIHPLKYSILTIAEETLDLFLPRVFKSKEQQSTSEEEFQACTSVCVLMYKLKKHREKSLNFDPLIHINTHVHKSVLCMYDHRNMCYSCKINTYAQSTKFCHLKISKIYSKGLPKIVVRISLWTL